jgi:hypothetical protein
MRDWHEKLRPWAALFLPGGSKASGWRRAAARECYRWPGTVFGGISLSSLLIMRHGIIKGTGLDQREKQYFVPTNDDE